MNHRFTLRLAMVGLVALAGSAGLSVAEVIIGGSSLNPLWTGTPDPGFFPTDYVGNFGDNFVDESGSQAWPGGGMEPGPHTYNVFTRTLHMSNSFSASRVKILLLRIVWAPSTVSPPPIIQPVGSVLDQTLWPRATPLNPDGTPVLDGEGNPVRAEIQAASVEVSSAGAIVATMRFLFDPQPAGETIRLPNGFIENRYPAAIGAQTICIPTPATAALAGAGVLFAASRRRR